VPKPLKITIPPEHSSSGVAVALTEVGAAVLTVIGLGVTEVVPQTLVAEKVYVPASAAAMLVRVVFCKATEKLFGPVHE
jgi:hypothetical protein